MMIGIDKETVELIQETAVAASGAEGKLAVIRPPGEPPHVYLTVRNDGSHERRLAEPHPRAHELGALDQVVRFCEEKGSESTVVWHDQSGVTVILDDSTRRDFAKLTFTPTPQFARLQILDRDRPGFAQRDFRKLLRVELAGCFDSPRLLNWVSDVRFASASNSGGNLRSERESLGRELESQVTSSAGEIPEEVPLSVRLFDDPSLQERQGIKCLFDLSQQDQMFRLIPLPLELHSAVEREIAYVGEYLAKGLSSLSIPIFRGAP